jgi:hypothetical protein
VVSLDSGERVQQDRAYITVHLPNIGCRGRIAAEKEKN